MICLQIYVEFVCVLNTCVDSLNTYIVCALSQHVLPKVSGGKAVYRSMTLLLKTLFKILYVITNFLIVLCKHTNIII